MNSIIVALVLSSSIAMAASKSKVVEKSRVLDEVVVAATACSISGTYDGSEYGTAGYQYTVTMQVSVKQKIEIYSVQVKKERNGRITETLIANSTKSAPDRIVASTQSITAHARYPTEDYSRYLLKGCEDEMIFINTGAYPPPPPKPVVVDPPKKEEPKAPTPVTPPATDPLIPGLPGQLPGTPGEVPDFPITPVDFPQLPNP